MKAGCHSFIYSSTPFFLNVDSLLCQALCWGLIHKAEGSPRARVSWGQQPCAECCTEILRGRAAAAVVQGQVTAPPGKVRKGLLLESTVRLSLAE